MKEKNLDRRTRELQESKGKGKSKEIVAAVLITTLASSFCLGMMGVTEVKAAGLHESQTNSPEIITIEVPAEMMTEVPVIVEVENEVSRKFREFEDLAELTEWLEKNSLPIRLIAGEDGRIDLLNYKSTSQYDCDDYAEALQRKALEQGFLMSQQLVLNGQVYGVKVSKYTGPHMGNLAVIGNNIYYIESIPPHSVVIITSRD